MGGYVNNKKDLVALLKANERSIRSYGVIQLGFFGSFVRDEANENSDIDFYISFDPAFKTLKNFVGLANFLERLCGRKIEIVTPQSLNKFIGKYIIKEVEYVPFAA